MARNVIAPKRVVAPYDAPDGIQHLVTDLNANYGQISKDINSLISAGSIDTVDIADNAITNAKLRDSGALSVIGRSANSSGDPADISAVAASDAVLRESGSTIGFGTVATAGIADNAITNLKLRDSGALSVIGRSANSSGDPSDISATATSGAVLRESGSTIGFGTVATAGIAADAIDNTKLANMADSTIKGRAVGAGTGDPTDLTGTQAGAVIVVASTQTTPTVTAGSGSFTTVSSTVNKITVGKLVFFDVTITITTNGTAAIDVRIASFGTTPLRQTAVYGYNGDSLGQGITGRLSTSGDLRLFKYDSTYPGGSGVTLNVSGVCEVA